MDLNKKPNRVKTIATIYWVLSCVPYFQYSFESLPHLYEMCSIIIPIL